MNTDAFHAWLNATFRNKGTVASRLSEARRVEAEYGDLDSQYSYDRLEGLIDNLEYSVVDERQNAKNPTRIVIGGNVKNGLASLRTSLRCYQRYADQSVNQK